MIGEREKEFCITDQTNIKTGSPGTYIFAKISLYMYNLMSSFLFINLSYYRDNILQNIHFET